MPAKNLIIPEGSEAELRALLELNAEQISSLRRVLGDKKGLKEGRGYQRVGQELAIGNDLALKVLSATNNIRAQRDRFGLTDAQLIEDLSSFVDRPLSDETKTALLDLLTKSDDDYFIHKVSSLKHGFVPHFLDARTVVDARPIFDKERTRIEGYLLVTYLELTSHAYPSDEYSTTTYYLSRKDIKALRAKLDDAEAKLARLEASLSSTEVYD